MQTTISAFDNTAQRSERALYAFPAATGRRSGRRRPPSVVYSLRADLCSPPAR
jgi:hypothetical protein